MVALILGTGFEPLEAVAPCDILRRGGVEVCCASVGERLVEAGHGIRIEADCTVAELDAEKLDMIVLPGGLGGVQSILGSEKTLELIRRVYDEGKFVAAICAAPSILAKLGITDGRKATCYPGFEPKMGSAVMQSCGAIRDGTVITGRAAGSSEEFGLLLLEALKGKAAAEKVAGEIVYSR